MLWWCLTKLLYRQSGVCRHVHLPRPGLPLVREKSGKFKVREKSGNLVLGQWKFEILRKVREIQENPVKVREI